MSSPSTKLKKSKKKSSKKKNKANSKKAAKVNGGTKAKAKDVMVSLSFQSKLDSDGPVLCSFSGGAPPADAREATFHLHGHTDKRKKHQRVLEADTDVMRYSARNFGSGSAAFRASQGRFAVALVPKSETVQGTTLTAKLFNVSTPVLPITAVVKAVEEAEVARAAKAVAATNSDDYATKKRLLVETFGSTKRQRIVRSNQANRINLDEVEADRLLTNARSSIKSDPNERKWKLQRTWLPPRDADTTDIASVYQLSTMVGDEAFTALSAPGKLLLKLAKKPSELAKSAHPDVVKGCVSMLLTLEKAQQKRAAKAVAYLDALLTFFALPRKGKIDALKETEIPEAVQAHLLDTFTITVTKGSKTYRDHKGPMEKKLMCWLAVGCLLTHRYTMNKTALQTLAADLAVTVTKLQTFFKEVGCPKASKTKAVLVAPLSLPELRNAKKQR